MAIRTALTPSVSMDLSVMTQPSSHTRHDTMFLQEHSEHPDGPHFLRIDPRRFVPKLLDIFNIGAGINRGMAVGAALAAQFQHP